jgi:hypothetical protein
LVLFYAAGLFESDTHTPPWGGHACTFLWREKKGKQEWERPGEMGEISTEKECSCTLNNSKKYMSNETIVSIPAARPEIPAPMITTCFFPLVMA